MQRKGDLLMKRGFTLITAIIFIVLIATIAALSLSFSTFSTKQTSDLYLREQAELLLQSGTEFALLAISGHDIVANNNCINTITAQYPQAGANALFDITVSLSYIGNGLPDGCNTYRFGGGSGKYWISNGREYFR